MDKVAPFLQKDKGLDLKEHMVEIEEMAQLGAVKYKTEHCFLISISSWIV